MLIGRLTRVSVIARNDRLSVERRLRIEGNLRLTPQEFTVPKARLAIDKPG